MWLYNQNDEEVARHEVSNHPEQSYFHHSVALTHTEKVELDSAFTFCFMVADQGALVSILPNGFEWGYKILGSEYNVTESDFDHTDFIFM